MSETTEVRDVGLHPHRRPVYKPKSQTGVTDFQSILRDIPLSPDTTATVVERVKRTSEEIRRASDVSEESNGNTETDQQDDDDSDEEEEANKAVEGKTSSQHLIVDILDPNFCVFVPRDYSGFEIAFRREYPKELHGTITVEQFQYTVDTVNEILYSAQKISCGSCMESLAAYLTCSLILACKKTRMEKAFEKTGRFLYDVNEEIYHPKGLHVVHPMCRGLRTIVIRSIANYPLYSYAEKETTEDVEKEEPEVNVE